MQFNEVRRILLGQTDVERVYLDKVLIWPEIPLDQRPNFGGLDVTYIGADRKSIYSAFALKRADYTPTLVQMMGEDDFPLLPPTLNSIVDKDQVGIKEAFIGISIDVEYDLVYSEAADSLYKGNVVSMVELAGLRNVPTAFVNRRAYHEIPVQATMEIPEFLSKGDVEVSVPYDSDMPLSYIGTTTKHIVDVRAGDASGELDKVNVTTTITVIEGLLRTTAIMSVNAKHTTDTVVNEVNEVNDISTINSSVAFTYINMNATIVGGYPTFSFKPKD